ncbi:hypothetical protein HDU97_004969 [Phlyctochytrium planicorne]|nr:hypothetical protein HDU97_004969 [Phlyctochytrium planicorne]
MLTRIIIALCLSATSLVTAQTSNITAEASKNAQNGQCTLSCTTPTAASYQFMIDSDTNGKIDLTGCRPITPADLPKYNQPGPFPSEAAPGQNVAMTKYGPVDDADRFLLQSVRRACLWEEPLSRDAQTMATCSKTKESAKVIQDDHVFLDKAVKEIADELNIMLPDDLTPNIQRFVQEMSCAQGADWDSFYAMRLRQAHGNIFPSIAQVRTRTRNNLMRQFATIANAIVMKHMAVLEATDLVDFAILPPAVIKKSEPLTSNLQISPATNK